MARDPFSTSFKKLNPRQTGEIIINAVKQQIFLQVEDKAFKKVEEGELTSELSEPAERRLQGFSPFLSNRCLLSSYV